MYKLFIAFRYLTSRPISLVSIVGIFLSVGALIVVISVMSGFLRDTKAFIRGTMSDIVITPYPEERSVNSIVYGDDPLPFEKVREIIRSVPGVTGVAPRFVRPALITCPDRIDRNKGSSKFSDINFTKVLGIDTVMESEVSRMDRLLVEFPSKKDQVARPEEPFFLEMKDRPPKHFSKSYPCILIGERKMKSLHLKRGDVVALMTLDESVLEAPRDGDELTVKPFEQKFFISGAFSSNNLQFDMEFVICEMSAAWEWLGLEGEVNEIYVSTENYETQGALIKHKIQLALSEVNYSAWVETWEDRNRVFLGAVRNERTILGVILGFFILIATFNVYATISMMVTDKTKDIGILISTGASAFGILQTFVTCGLFMWAIGSSLGTVGGYFFARYINPIKDAIEYVTGVQVFDPDVYNFKTIPVEISPIFISVIIVGTFFMCLFFSLLPALRASWMDPVKALRHE